MTRASARRFRKDQAGIRANGEAAARLPANPYPPEAFRWGDVLRLRAGRYRVMYTVEGGPDHGFARRPGHRLAVRPACPGHGGTAAQGRIQRRRQRWGAASPARRPLPAAISGMPIRRQCCRGCSGGRVRTSQIAADVTIAIEDRLVVPDVLCTPRTWPQRGTANGADATDPHIKACRAVRRSPQRGLPASPSVPAVLATTSPG
jgi:hypothetical protein